MTVKLIETRTFRLHNSLRAFTCLVVGCEYVRLEYNVNIFPLGKAAFLGWMTV